MFYQAGVKKSLHYKKATLAVLFDIKTVSNKTKTATIHEVLQSKETDFNTG